MTTTSGADTPTLLVTFCRFLLEQVNKELSPASPPAAQAAKQPALSIVDTLMGFSTRTELKCINCSASWQRSSRSLLVDLVDARHLPERQDPATTFSEVAEASLCRTIQSKAWCDRCSHYQQTEQRKLPESLPAVLCFCSNTTREEGAWPGLAASVASASETPAASPWLPLRLRIATDPATNKIVVKELESTAGAVAPDDASVYELVALICHIVDPHPKTPASGNLVAHVKVPQEYLARRGGNSSNTGWFLLNDFRVAPISEREVVRFPSWKRPLIVFYSCPALCNKVPLPAVVSPIDGTPFFSRTLLNLVPTVLPLVLPSPSLLPKRGEHIAFDAEYVSLSAEGIVSELDGTQVAVTPSHLSVARVTCIFGEGPLVGKALVDDYVVAVEPVVDYLTRFSGISPGDLDPAISKKRLTTLKTVYLKLRYLIDCGCVFIGHGLRNDMKVIGLHLPREQAIDTVELFHAERQRWVSLRFLAAFLLRIDIQATVHDSIEDARTALALYNVYLRLKQTDQLQSTIQEIYRVGYASNWQLPLKY